jgi:hypothetical protein
MYQKITLSLLVFASTVGAVLPGVHWETDTADYAHLLPKSHVTVFYSDVEPDANGTIHNLKHVNFILICIFLGKMDVAHLWAEYITDVVALEHSQYVETVHCSERGPGGVADMTITFNDNAAYELAREQWSAYSELLFIGANFTHPACFPDVHEDSNRFWVMYVPSIYSI